jgi:hypothetical protein
MAKISRRSFLKSAGVAAAVIVAPGCERSPHKPQVNACNIVF